MTQSVILAALASASAPLTAKELATAIGKSESRTRELLKAEQDAVLCKKNDAGANVFWIEPEGKALVNDAATGCPFCQATDGQAPAGPEGTFLGAALTCGSCGKTYNAVTREEVVDMPDKTKAKRKPLNPQYRINAKIAAVEGAGGKLTYDKPAREWVLSKKGKDPRRMSAQDFANETEETLIASIS